MRSESELYFPFFLTDMDLHDIYDLYIEQEEDNLSPNKLVSTESCLFQESIGKLLLVLLNLPVIFNADFIVDKIFSDSCPGLVLIERYFLFQF